MIQNRSGLKILTLSNSPLDETQGSGYVIIGFARQLRKRGHHVDVLDPADIQIPKRGRIGNRYRLMIGMTIKALASLTGGYDIFEFYGGEAWLAVSVLRTTGRRPLLVAHSNGLEPHASQKLAEARFTDDQYAARWYQADLSALYRRAFSNADAVVTVSQFDREFAQRNGYQVDRRLLTIENPLPDTYLGQPLSHERPANLVFCGAWTGIKGVDRLRRDVSDFLALYSEWKLILVGVGSGFRAIDHFPEVLIDRLEVIPYVTREPHLMHVYRRSRVAIQTSVYESFCLASAEAMACGCALVASKVGFAASLIDGEEALLFPSTSNPSLIDCLSRFAQDEMLRRKIAERGYRRVQGLRWDAAANRLEDAYHSWFQERQNLSAGRPKSS